MQYHNITTDDMLNGEGLRVVLWVAGCSHACPGCHNPVTWDPNGGLDFDEAAKEEIFAQLEHSYIHGITYSGGDPLYMGNRQQLLLWREKSAKSIPRRLSGFIPAICGRKSKERKSFRFWMLSWMEDI